MKIMLLVLLISVESFAEASNDVQVRKCLQHWKKAPFEMENLDYRTISTSVKVLGTGKSITDAGETEKPELIFLKTTVNVLSRNVIRLLNPNGWYCLEASTNVLGKAIIELHCDAKLALSNTGATVLGRSKGEQQSGTTVLGETKIKRVGCKN